MASLDAVQDHKISLFYSECGHWDGNRMRPWRAFLGLSLSYWDPPEEFDSQAYGDTAEEAVTNLLGLIA